MRPRIPIGYDDFRILREEKLEYVDKSDLIRDLIERSDRRWCSFQGPGGSARR
ncbi:MAG: hypothetical protein R3F14_45940 [Polyangiaceae bacterium]